MFSALRRRLPALLPTVAIGAAALVWAGPTAANASAPSCSSVGTSFSNHLNPGQCIKSSSGGYQFIMQTDGNLVLYRSNGSPCWASNTDGDRGDIAVFGYTSHDPNPPGTSGTEPVLYNYNIQVKIPNGGYHYNKAGSYEGGQNLTLNVDVNTHGAVYFGYTKLGSC